MKMVAELTHLSFFALAAFCCLFFLIVVPLWIYCYCRRRRLRMRNRPPRASIVAASLHMRNSQRTAPAPQQHDTLKKEILRRVIHTLRGFPGRKRTLVNMCSICLDKLNRTIDPEPGNTALGILKGCQHLFHFNCIWKWLEQQKRCPLCRKHVTLSTNDIVAASLECLPSKSENDKRKRRSSLNKLNFTLNTTDSSGSITSTLNCSSTRKSDHDPDKSQVSTNNHVARDSKSNHSRSHVRRNSRELKVSRRQSAHRDLPPDSTSSSQQRTNSSVTPQLRSSITRPPIQQTRPHVLPSNKIPTQHSMPSGSQYQGRGNGRGVSHSRSFNHRGASYSQVHGGVRRLQPMETIHPPPLTRSRTPIMTLPNSHL